MDVQKMEAHSARWTNWEEM